LRKRNKLPTCCTRKPAEGIASKKRRKACRSRASPLGEKQEEKKYISNSYVYVLSFDRAKERYQRKPAGVKANGAKPSRISFSTKLLTSFVEQ